MSECLPQQSGIFQVTFFTWVRYWRSKLSFWAKGRQQYQNSRTALVDQTFSTILKKSHKERHLSLNSTNCITLAWNHVVKWFVLAFHSRSVWCWLCLQALLSRRNADATQLWLHLLAPWVRLLACRSRSLLTPDSCSPCWPSSFSFFWGHCEVLPNCLPTSWLPLTQVSVPYYLYLFGSYYILNVLPVVLITHSSVKSGRASKPLSVRPHDSDIIPSSSSFSLNELCWSHCFWLSWTGWP